MKSNKYLKMKQTILGALLLLSTTFQAQSVSLAQNTSYGQNCGNNQTVQEVIVNGDLNLNGYTLTLRNVKLVVTNNLNGAGEIKNCGQSNSSIVVQGSVQNNPNLNGMLATLSVPKFDLLKNYGYKYKVYNLEGKLIQEGITDKNTQYNLKREEIIIFVVEGFKPLKLYNQSN